MPHLLHEGVASLVRAVRGGSNGVVDAHDAEQERIAQTAFLRLGSVLDRPLDTNGVIVLREHFVRQQSVVGRSMLQSLSGAERTIRTGGLRDLQRQLAVHGDHKTPLDDERAFQRAIGRPNRMEIARQRHAVSSWLTRTRRETEREIRASFAAGRSTREALSRTQATASVFRGGVTRIAETELSRAYNSAKNSGLILVSRKMPGIYKRWVEHVDDSGKPKDNKVADDSMALHGQVTLPDSSFWLEGRTHPYPPNRPNCRSTLMPWRKTWGIPGWLIRDGKRVSLSK